MSARDPALDTAGRFASFLNRTIKELKPVDEFKPVRPELLPAVSPFADRPGLNKFTELAAKLKANRAEMHIEADKLSAETDAVMETFRGAVGKHRTILADAKSGVQDMRDAANVLSNFDPNDSETPHES